MVRHWQIPLIMIKIPRCLALGMKRKIEVSLMRQELMVQATACLPFGLFDDILLSN